RMLMLVPTGPMVVALECHEGVNGLDRLPVSGRDPDLPAPWKLGIGVGYDVPLFGHGRRARDGLRVNETRDAEIAGREVSGDLLQVPPDRDDAFRILDIALEFDSPSIGKGVEEVGGGILIHTHGDLATR